MTREWKPGDVALVDDPVHGAMIAIHVGHDPAHRCWHGAVDNGDLRCLDSSPGVDARALVVIDPEDRKSIQALRDLFDAAWLEQHGDSLPLSTLGARGNALQAALREFANPTPSKPEEPQGLGAVAEDEQGRRWLRWWAPGHGRPHPSQDRPWTCANGGGPDRRYADIAVVRVLSEGVKAGGDR